MLSRRWFCATWSSRSLRSVTSAMKPSKKLTTPSGPGTGRPRSITHLVVPSRVRIR
jgi:hypothetical protein